MQLQGKISVIIPAWGDTPMLERACNSIRGQTYKNTEIVTAAPPSNATGALQAAARTVALGKASGDWIAFCDADDWIEPDAFRSMLDAAVRDSSDCVCCGIIRDGLDGTSVVRRFDPTGPNDTYNSLCNKLFRRELLEGIVQDNTVSLGEDLMVAAQAMRKAKRITILDQAFYHYCENASSITHTQDGRKRVEDLFRVGDVLRSAMPETRFDDFHDRVSRDALLLWLRFRIFDRSLWRAIRSRMKGGLADDPRHGFIKKGALCCAGCLFD